MLDWAAFRPPISVVHCATIAQLAQREEEEEEEEEEEGPHVIKARIASPQCLNTWQIIFRHMARPFFLGGAVAIIIVVVVLSASSSPCNRSCNRRREHRGRSSNDGGSGCDCGSRRGSSRSKE